MLKLEKLNLEIDWKKILSNINLELKNNEILALLWHNGSWKTSILKTIMWLYNWDWKIIFNGEEIQELEIFERANKWIGYIMQEVPEYTGISVAQYVKGILKDKFDEQKINEQFDLFGLDWETYKTRNFDSHLSWWEKKKVEIIVSFMLDKQIYLLDEVETSLDATSRNILKNMILEQQKQGKSFIIVSHHEELVKLAETAILLCNGQIQEKWNTEDLYNKYTWSCIECGLKNNCG